MLKRKLIQQSEALIKSDPNKFWQFVRKNKVASRLPGSLKLCNKTISNLQEIFDAFSSFFESVYQPPSNIYSSFCLDSSSLPNVSVTECSEQDIIRVMKRLKSTSTAGADQVPSFLLGDCALLLLLLNHKILFKSCK